MKNNVIVEEYYHKIHTWVYNLIQNKKQYAEDFTQDICLQLLSMDNKRLNRLYEKDELRAYILGLIKLSLHSKTSRFYYTYVRPEGCDKGETLPEIPVKPDFDETCLLDSDTLTLLNHFAQSGSNIKQLAKELGKSYYKTRKIIKNIKDNNFL